MDDYENNRPSVSEIVRESQGVSVPEALDKFLAGSSVGQVSTAIGDSFYGINHRQTPGAVPVNKDYYGLTFFTRPRLNMTTDNLRASRLLTPLLTNESESIQRIIRCLLDPELDATGITSAFVDSDQAFIPILTNHLISINGWPDVSAPIFTSEQGVYREVYSHVDGLTTNYEAYDITATFRNLPGDPITALFLAWVHYSSLVYQGVLVPYPDMIVKNEIDYNTRIYRLVLDSTKTKVQKIAACGAAFPVNAPIGAAFNYESDRPINASNDQISIHFQAIGAMYQDDILADEFNRTTQMFCDTLRDGARERHFKKVPMDALAIFNNRGYPRINPDTYELEWYVSNEQYAARLPAVKDTRSNSWKATPLGSEREIEMNYTQKFPPLN